MREHITLEAYTVLRDPDILWRMICSHCTWTHPLPAAADFPLEVSGWAAEHHLRSHVDANMAECSGCGSRAYVQIGEWLDAGLHVDYRCDQCRGHQWRIRRLDEETTR
jgi:hypothetical protein